MAGGTASGTGEEDKVDHYAVLGLSSGEEGASLSLKQIEKAYREQSRLRHPDKRPDDPNATADFQRLKSSFELLKDESRRREFDARLRARRDRALRDSALSAKRRKLAADLDERERAAAAAEEGKEDVFDPAEQAKRREKEVASQLKREKEAFQARKASEKTGPPSTSTPGKEKGEENGRTAMLDKERLLKVSWERDLGDYSAVKLRELFERFGAVEDVVIRTKGSKKRGSAIVVMSSKDAAVTATHSMSGSLSNPLLVLPLQAASNSSPARSAEPINPKLGNIVGAGFQDYEASIMKKLQKANEKRKNM
ncbi:LOW QUALITY PROTEIN: dnaJ homolog subfamily C member 17-like [Phoenix dactylifera]|uniref:LOW QUALITY PROTEIN: dnaJ homolog subfamily C member 17-like n=1 Tax=Phoenix dactylifera TaxID=42345 RepID=A0A8B8ZZL4_PHODC|nr:LOW QUALITY PROTEIN: dnaJ homolog subfamily C member 17-like [Phoenix dactylifera]